MTKVFHVQVTIDFDKDYEEEEIQHYEDRDDYEESMKEYLSETWQEEVSWGNFDSDVFVFIEER